MSQVVTRRQATPLLHAIARFLVAAVLAVVAPAAVAAPPAAGSVVQFNRETYTYSSSLSVAQEAQRYSVMVLQASNSALVPQLRAANPGLKILMYSDVMDSRLSDPGVATCTSYAADNASHPGWFLLDQQGHRLVNHGYPGNYLMDEGNPGYQQACASHALAEAKQYGFSGVYFDGFTAWIGWAITPGLTTRAYPTPAAWQSAVYSLISHSAPVIHAQKLLMVGNIGGAVTAPGLWQKWTAPMDGSEDEQFADANFTYYWPSQIANAAWSEANGKLALLHSHSTTETGNTFALASLMLVAQGRSSYSTSNANTANSELWFPEYPLAQSLGAPTSPSTPLPGGVDGRAYASGLVLVNASASSQNLSLAGGTYSGSQLRNVTRVTLAPWSGVILRNNAPRAPGAPLNLVRPAIVVSGPKGQTLTANHALWSAAATPTYTYQWSRCTTTTASTCTAISRARAGTYRLQAADSGRYVVVAVTADNQAGARTALSLPMAIGGSVRQHPLGASHLRPICVSPAGKLARARLGALSLGETRRAARAAFRKYTTRGHRYIDIYCLSGGGLRAGYASSQLLKRLSIHAHRHLIGRLVIALTSNRFYSLRRIKPGTAFTLARRAPRLERVYASGGNTWYILRGHGGNGVMKVHSGQVEEVGIVNAQLTSTHVRARVFFKSLLR